MKCGVKGGNHLQKDDEWYTSEELAKEFIDFHWKYIKKFKKIICPCDSEESYIYRELKARGCDVDCCMDMWNCDYSNYDLVVTNPPFSMAFKGMRGLNDKVKIKFISFCGGSTAVALLVESHYINEIYMTISRQDVKIPTCKHFYNQSKGCSGAVLSNIDECREMVLRKEKINIKYEGNYRGIYRDFLRGNYLDPQLRGYKKRGGYDLKVYYSGDKCELGNEPA